MSFSGLEVPSRPDSGSDDAVVEWSDYKCGFLGHTVGLKSGQTCPFSALCFSEAPFPHLENRGGTGTPFASWCEGQGLVLCLANSKC